MSWYCPNTVYTIMKLKGKEREAFIKKALNDAKIKGDKFFKLVKNKEELYKLTKNGTR